MNAENFSFSWKGNISCEDCSTRLNVFRKKKTCFFCKNSFCQVCVVRQEDKKFCCRKCEILTARPLDRSKLLNLRSRDLINYLTSRRIPTDGCVEKEDLVNVLMKAVSNSCFHPSSSTYVESTSSTKSYPNNPRSNSNTSGQTSQSTQTLQDDGIRIIGHNSSDSILINDNTSHGEEMDWSSQEDSILFSSTSHVEEMDWSSQEDEQNSHRLSETNEAAVKHRSTSTDFTVGESSEPSPLKKPLLLSDIKNRSELDALSVKQLKELLLRNRMDFKGCIEREELVKKAYTLWNDYKVSRKDLENLSLNDLCKICMDAPLECVLLECGHMACCTSCGKQLRECPICRQFVVRCVRTFKA